MKKKESVLLPGELDDHLASSTPGSPAPDLVCSECRDVLGGEKCPNCEQPFKQGDKVQCEDGGSNHYCSMRCIQEHKLIEGVVVDSTAKLCYYCKEDGENTLATQSYTAEDEKKYPVCEKHAAWVRDNAPKMKLTPITRAQEKD